MLNRLIRLRRVRHICVATSHMSGITRPIPSREQMLINLKGASGTFSASPSSSTPQNGTGSQYDVLIIGGGATGSGAALDAASRGLKVACVEREDFGSGTSSRSTKLIWGGSRYLVQAFVSLLSTQTLRSPRESWEKFLGDFHMVLNCHKERKFMLEKQAHLTNWIPIGTPPFTHTLSLYVHVYLCVLLYIH